MLPAIFGLEGTELTDAERSFFREVSPFGYIIFGRNVVDRAQLQSLTESLRNLHGRAVPILIDQEGGRVARMQSPEWLAYPPARCFADLYAVRPGEALLAAQVNYEALGLDLAEVGVNVTCAPVLDVPIEGAHDVIGDRAFGLDPDTIIKLGRACLDGLQQAGIAGVIKHIPGHGRSVVDSHHDLPRVAAGLAELEQDLRPFRALNDASMAMTAHIVYDAWDSDHCATLSHRVIQDVIRGDIGFAGLLMSDDLDMKALAGSVPDLALAAQQAGCDVVLNCWAKLSDMEGIAKRLASPGPDALNRMQRVCDALPTAQSPLTITARQQSLAQQRDELLALLG